MEAFSVSVRQVPRAGSYQVSWTEVTEQAASARMLLLCLFLWLLCTRVVACVSVDRVSCGAAPEWYETGWSMSSFEGLSQHDSRCRVTASESQTNTAIWKISTVAEKDTLSTILSLMITAQCDLSTPLQRVCFEWQDHPERTTVVLPCVCFASMCFSALEFGGVMQIFDSMCD